MGQLIVFLVIAGIIYGWVSSGIRAHNKGGGKLLTNYFINLGIAVAVVFILWVIIVYPSLDCNGFLCGLGEVITWLIISGIVLLVWPLVLLSSYAKAKKEPVSNDDLIDDIL